MFLTQFYRPVHQTIFVITFLLVYVFLVNKSNNVYLKESLFLNILRWIIRVLKGANNPKNTPRAPHPTQAQPDVLDKCETASSKLAPIEKGQIHTIRYKSNI